MSTSVRSKEQSYIKNEITEEDIKNLVNVFENLEADKQAYDFLEPVDYVSLGILDYPKIIEKPMDLGTCKKKLLNGEYKIFQDFLSDINLIWTNCRTYNLPGSDIVKMANHCEKTFRKLIDKFFKNYQKDSKTSTTKNEGIKLTPTEKMKLVEKIREQSNENLTEIVKLLLKEAPKTIEDVDNEKLKIKLDLLDHRLYELIIDYIETSNINNENKENNKNSKVASNKKQQ